MQWLVLPPHSKKDPGSIQGQDASVWSLRVLFVSARVSGCRLIGHSKLPKGVKVSADGCLSLNVSPAMNW